MTNEGFVPPAAGGGGGGRSDGGPTSDAGTLAGAPAPLRGLAVSAAELFVAYVDAGDAGADGGPTGGVVARAPRTGGKLEVVVTGGGGPRSLHFADGTLTWLDDDTSTSLVRYSGSGVSALLTGLPPSSAFAVTPTATFVASANIGTLNVDRVPDKEGGAVTPLGTLPGDFAVVRAIVAEPSIYVLVSQLAGGGLYKVPLAGGVPENVWSAASGTPRDMAIASGKAFVALDKGSSGAIVAVALSNGAPAELATTTPAPRYVGIAGATPDVVVSTTSGDVSRVPAAGGVLSSLATGLGSPAAMAVADAVYLAIGNGVVRVAL